MEKTKNGYLGFLLMFIKMDKLSINITIQTLRYGKCSKISNTLKLRTPKIIAENNFKNILKNRTLPFFGKMNV